MAINGSLAGPIMFLLIFNIVPVSYTHLMIAGENEYVRYINFEEGMTPEQLAQKFNAAFDEFRTCDGVVVLSDLCLLYTSRCV